MLPVFAFVTYAFFPPPFFVVILRSHENKYELIHYCLKPVQDQNLNESKKEKAILVKKSFLLSLCVGDGKENLPCEYEHLDEDRGSTWRWGAV